MLRSLVLCCTIRTEHTGYCTPDPPSPPTHLAPIRGERPFLLGGNSEMAAKTTFCGQDRSRLFGAAVLSLRRQLFSAYGLTRFVSQVINFRSPLPSRIAVRIMSRGSRPG